MEKLSIYRIRPNYCTYPYKSTVKKFHSPQITASALFVFFFIQTYVVGTHLNCTTIWHFFVQSFRGGWVMWRCPVAFVTRAPNWYWLTVGQGLLSLQQVRVEGEYCYFLCSFTFFHFPLSSLSLLLFLLSLFSLSLGDDTKWLTRVDVSLNPNTIQLYRAFHYENMPIQIHRKFHFLKLKIFR